MVIPLVSIIIPAYNAEQFVGAAIRSALDQTWPCKEIIVINDGSTDRTGEIAKRYESQGVKVIFQDNAGAAAARNRGIAESTGEYFQFLDSDDLLKADKIESQLSMALGTDERVLYSGAWGIFYHTPFDVLIERNSLWSDSNDPIKWLIESWTRQQWMHPSVWLTPRTLVEAAGPWDETLSLHDDGDYFSRVILQSKAIKFCDRAMSYYRKGIASSLSSLISDRALQSHWRICQLYESRLTSIRNSPEARFACASNYMAFYYEHFPHRTSLRNEALHAAQRLGGGHIQARGTLMFDRLRKFLGWRAAMYVERFYYQRVRTHPFMRSIMNRRATRWPGEDKTR